MSRLVSGKKTKWAVLVVWIVLIMGLGGFASKLNDVQKNDNSAWLPKSAESTKELNLEAQFHPNWYPAILLYVRDSGLTPQDHDQIDAAVKALQADSPAGKDLEQVVHKAVTVVEVQTGPQAGRAAQIIVPVDPGNSGWNKFPDTIAALKKAMGTNSAGLETHVTGPLGVAGDEADSFKKINGSLTYITIGVVILILLVAYRSPLLWLMPIVTAGAALGVGQGIIYLLAKHAGLTVNGQAAFILIVLLLGAGTDYALLLIARYREELRNYEDRHEAMAHALHRAGPAVFASSATVALNMLILLVAEMNSTKGLGPVLAVGVVVTLLAMMSLLPALLVICGRWIFWPVKPTLGSAEPTQSGVWSRVGKRIAVKPRIVWILTALILGAMAAGVSQLNAHQQTSAEQFVDKPDSVVGAEVQAKYFPAASGQPIAVIADADKLAQVTDAIKTVPGIDPNTVGAPASIPHAVIGKLGYVEATPLYAADSPEAKKVVDAVRSAVHAVPGADAKVGGGPAVLLDISRANSHDAKLIIPLILLVVFVILALLLRALLAPLLLMGTVILSFGAALGVSALMFKGFGWNGVDISLPLFGFVFLVALGIDYNIFLMTRIREESVRRGTRRGAIVGLSATGGVITWAGLVLAATFGVLATMPIVPFAEIGFTVAFGVLLDTMIVRSVLVTALTLDIGKKMWWPSALSKADEPAGGTLAAARDDEGEPALV